MRFLTSMSLVSLVLLVLLTLLAGSVAAGPLVYGQFAGLNNWPFGAALAFVLMSATLTLSAVSNVLVQRRYRR